MTPRFRYYRVARRPYIIFKIIYIYLLVDILLQYYLRTGSYSMQSTRFRWPPTTFIIYTTYMCAGMPLWFARVFVFRFTVHWHRRTTTAAHTYIKNNNNTYFNRRQCVDLWFDHCCNGVCVCICTLFLYVYSIICINIPIHNIWVGIAAATSEEKPRLMYTRETRKL